MIISIKQPVAGMEPKRILIIEDNSIERFVVSQWLRHLQYKVVEAATADEAVIILQSSLSIDVVITDVAMPGKLNGLDLLCYIKKTFPLLPVIIVSSADLETMPDLERGKYCFFQKPYELDALSSEIQRHLHHTDEPEREISSS